MISQPDEVMFNFISYLAIYERIERRTPEVDLDLANTFVPFGELNFCLHSFGERIPPRTNRLYKWSFPTGWLRSIVLFVLYNSGLDFLLNNIQE